MKLNDTVEVNAIGGIGFVAQTKGYSGDKYIPEKLTYDISSSFDSNYPANAPVMFTHTKHEASTEMFSSKEKLNILSRMCQRSSTDPESDALREDVQGRLNPILLAEEKQYFENLNDEVLSTIATKSGWIYGKKIYFQRKMKELSQRQWVHPQGTSFMQDVEDLYKRIESELSAINIRTRIFQIASACLLVLLLGWWIWHGVDAFFRERALAALRLA